MIHMGRSSFQALVPCTKSYTVAIKCHVPSIVASVCACEIHKEKHSSAAQQHVQRLKVFASKKRLKSWE